MRRLTFELRGHRRWTARAQLAKMYSLPLTGPARPAVDAPFERRVRPRPLGVCGRVEFSCTRHRGLSLRACSGGAPRICAARARARQPRNLSMRRPNNWLKLIASHAVGHADVSQSVICNFFFSPPNCCLDEACCTAQTAARRPHYLSRGATNAATSEAAQRFMRLCRLVAVQSHAERR